MSRKPRQISSTGIYHVTLRGVNRKSIFMDDMDKYKFLNVLRRVKEESEFHLYSYCLMGNHVHLLIREGKEPLSVLMKRIGVSYAYYFNQKYHCVGHLFQGRFFSKPVESDAYLVSVIRYICCNPVEAQAVERPSDYPWLGSVGLARDDLIDQDDVTAMLQNGWIDGLMIEIDNKDYPENREPLRMDDAEAERRICAACGCINASEIANWPKDHRDLAIRQALSNGVPIRRIAKLVGIGRSTVERIAKAEKGR